MARCRAICRIVQILATQRLHKLCATNLVVEECIPDIFRHFGHSHDIALTFLVSLGTDTIA